MSQKIAQRELPCQRMTQKRAASAITPIVGEESKMELEKGTKKLKIEESRLKTAAPSPAGENIDAPEDSPDRDLLRQKMAQKVMRKDGRPGGACWQVVDMGGLEFFTIQIESADGENPSEVFISQCFCIHLRRAGQPCRH